MHIEDLVYNAASWLSGEGGTTAWSLAAAPLSSQSRSVALCAEDTLEDQEKIIEQVLGAAQKCRPMPDAAFFQMNALQANQRQLLVERHLISPALRQKQGPARCAL